jgi:septal ring factor EnvC (AmiA/AmiB activator)
LRFAKSSLSLSAGANGTAEKEDGMTVALEEFRPWKDTVEARLDRLETVTSSMDKDFSEIRVEFGAQRKMLQALHLTQNEHTKTLAEHTKTLAEHSVALSRLETGQAKCLAGIQAILGLLQSANGSGR